MHAVKWLSILAFLLAAGCSAEPKHDLGKYTIISPFLPKLGEVIKSRANIDVGILLAEFKGAAQVRIDELEDVAKKNDWIVVERSPVHLLLNKKHGNINDVIRFKIIEGRTSMNWRRVWHEPK